MNIPLLDEFIEFKKSLNLQMKTINEYTDSIEKFVAWYLEFTEKSHLTRHSYKTIDQLELQTYLFELRKTKSINTTRKYLAGVSEFFRFLKSQKYIDVNPVAGIQMQKDDDKKEKVVMTYEEGMAIINSATNNRNKLMLSIMGEMGLRIEEICNIEIANIDLENNILLFLRKTQKWQTLPIRKTIRELLISELEIAKTNNQKYLFQSPNAEQPLNTNSVRDMFNKHRDKLGLSKEFTPHHYRYAFSTYLLQEKNMNVNEIQIFLGHNSQNTTLKYLHLNNSKTLDKFARMDD